LADRRLFLQVQIHGDHYFGHYVDVAERLIQESILAVDRCYCRALYLNIGMMDGRRERGILISLCVQVRKSSNECSDVPEIRW